MNGDKSPFWGLASLFWLFLCEIVRFIIQKAIWILAQSFGTAKQIQVPISREVRLWINVHLTEGHGRGKSTAKQ
jgi:hypothetical protein